MIVKGGVLLGGRVDILFVICMVLTMRFILMSAGCSATDAISKVNYTEV